MIGVTAFLSISKKYLVFLDITTISMYTYSMKRQLQISTLKKKRQDKLNTLGLCGPFIAGSLNRVEQKNKNGKVTVYYLLTFKQQSKTQSVYVPKDMVKEVRQWVRNYQKLKKVTAQISLDSICIIRRFVQEKRAATEKSREK